MYYQIDMTFGYYKTYQPVKCEVMYLCDRGVHFASFRKFSIRF